MLHKPFVPLKPASLAATLILIAFFMNACLYPASTPVAFAPTSPAGIPNSDNPQNISPDSSAPQGEPGASVPSGIIIQSTDNHLQIADPDGQISTLTESDRPFDSPLFQYFPGNRIAGGVLYATSIGDDGVNQVYAIDNGGVRLVPFVEGVSHGIAVWQGDGAQIARLAWDQMSFNMENNSFISHLFVSNADGTDARPVLEDPGPDRTLAVGRWSNDGQRLYFSREPLGLGGYILFGGASNLWAYNLTDGSATSLLAEPGTACIDDISPDETLIAHHCTNTAISIVQIASGNLTTITPPTEGVEANFMGGARFNPEGPQLAFGIARGDVNNEQGWVAVSDGLEGGSRVVAAAPAGQYFQVASWLDADTLILQSWGAAPGVWLVNIDGSELRQIAEGVYHAISVEQ